MKRNKKKIYKYPISDDTLDALETDIEHLNETKKLSEKISIHRKLNTITTNLENEIGAMVLKLDEINKLDTTSSVIPLSDPLSAPDIDIELLNIESMIQSMESYDTIQDKINEYEKIVHCIRKCKQIDMKPNMIVRTCN